MYVCMNAVVIQYKRKLQNNFFLNRERRNSRGWGGFSGGFPIHPLQVFLEVLTEGKTHT